MWLEVRKEKKKQERGEGFKKGKTLLSEWLQVGKAGGGKKQGRKRTSVPAEGKRGNRFPSHCEKKNREAEGESELGNTIKR